MFLAKMTAIPFSDRLNQIFKKVAWPTLPAKEIAPKKELIKRLTVKEKNYVQKDINKTLEDLKPMALAIKENAWESPLFKTKDWAPKVYALYHKNKITLEQLVSTLIFQSALAEFEGLKDIQVEIKTLIDADDFLDEFETLGSSAFEYFKERLSELPKSEQNYLKVFIHYPLQGSETIYDWESGLIQISESANFKGFHYRAHGKYFLVPSFSMMQIYLDMITEHPVKLNPVLGFSSIANIRDGLLHGARDIVIRFPQVNSITQAHGADYGNYLPTWHDFYHAVCLGHVPQNHRLAIYHLSEVLEAFEKWSYENNPNNLFDRNLFFKYGSDLILNPDYPHQLRKAAAELIDLDLAAYGKTRGVMPATNRDLGAALLETLGRLNHNALMTPILVLLTHMVFYRKRWIKETGIDPFGIGWGGEQDQIFQDLLMKLKTLNGG